VDINTRSWSYFFINYIVPDLFSSGRKQELHMETEEDALVKSTKAKALRECDDPVKGTPPGPFPGA
jgi:hypothetical protein